MLEQKHKYENSRWDIIKKNLKTETDKKIIIA